MANNKKPFYKRFWFWIIVVLILVFVGANSSSTSKTSKQNTSNNSTKKVTTSSSSKEASKPRNSKPKSAKTTIDKKLEARLKEDQDFADQGNASFAFSKYAYKITTNKNNELNIYVTGDFLQLSESQRNEVGRKLQAMGNSTLYEENKIDDDEYREKPITTFYLNKNVSVGVSQAFDHSKFHWNKKN
ncbi:hypothetical protein [Limosilactobacillus reuteri]|uniref:hypothetical protein n=1 Tax=Limosilactobacillus reuteri TaxID=1598 RepID=UPI001E4D7D9B|nr:hypothetical protein [Limosilactobacillus reuteri]MCC4331504.1 hypothetical protein [Limosilactobacillus reuteri]MCC4354807.1 hypothetical protein [Limosilactobacillus reuteri]